MKKNYFYFFTLLFSLFTIVFPVQAVQKLKTGSDTTSSGYISGNQYDIDILSYDLSIDLYPEMKLMKGNAILTGSLLIKKLRGWILIFMTT